MVLAALGRWVIFMRHGHGHFSLRVISPKSGLLLLTYAPNLRLSYGHSQTLHYFALHKVLIVNPIADVQSYIITCNSAIVKILLVSWVASILISSLVLPIQIFSILIGRFKHFDIFGMEGSKVQYYGFLAAVCFRFIFGFESCKNLKYQEYVNHHTKKPQP